MADQNGHTESAFPIKFSDDKGEIGEYLFYPLGWYEEEPFNRIIARHAVQPIVAVADLLPKLPDRERKEVWDSAKKAQSRWHQPTIAEAEGHAILIRTPEASAEFFEAAIKRAKPGISEEEFARLKKTATHQDLAVIYRVLMMLNVAPDATDPKGETTAEAVEETAEERDLRLQKEKEAKLLIQSWQERWERDISPFKWMSPQ